MVFISKIISKQQCCRNFKVTLRYALYAYHKVRFNAARQNKARLHSKHCTQCSLCRVTNDNSVITSYSSNDFTTELNVTRRSRCDSACTCTCTCKCTCTRFILSTSTVCQQQTSHESTGTTCCRPCAFQPKNSKINRLINKTCLIWMIINT